jgi:WD40 repeat protein
MEKKKLRGRGGKLVVSGHRQIIGDVACSLDGSKIASVDAGGEILFWEPWQKDPALKAKASRRLWSACWLQNDTQLLVGGDDGLELFDAGSAYRVRVSRDGRFVVAHTSNREEVRLIVWSTTGPTFTELHSFAHHKTMYSGFDFGEGSILSVTGQGEVTCRDLVTGEERWKRALAWSAHWLEVSPDGSRFAIVAADGPRGKEGAAVRIHDSNNGAHIQSLVGFTPSYCNPVRFSRDGRRLATSAYPNEAEQNLAIWDLNSGEIIWKESHARLETAYLAFTPDGTTLVSGGSDKKIRFWDLSELK